MLNEFNGLSSSKRAPGAERSEVNFHLEDQLLSTWLTITKEKVGYSSLRCLEQPIAIYCRQRLLSCLLLPFFSSPFLYIVMDRQNRSSLCISSGNSAPHTPRPLFGALRPFSFLVFGFPQCS
jgi:hypothetical protein